MHFTRGLITGAIIGAAVSMMMPSRSSARMKRKVFKNGSHFIRRAGNMIEDMIDAW